MASTMKKKEEITPQLTDFIFSWSISDIINKDLYKDKVSIIVLAFLIFPNLRYYVIISSSISLQVDKIPTTFASVDHYLKSFTIPLIEETHAAILSNVTALHSAPSREVYKVKKPKSTKPDDHILLYNVTLKAREMHSPKLYEPQFLDLVALSDIRPKCVSDLDRPKSPFTLAVVTRAPEDASVMIRVVSSKPVLFEDSKNGDKLFVVCLANLNTNDRIWGALHPRKEANTSIFTSVLSVSPYERYIPKNLLLSFLLLCDIQLFLQVEENCDVCSSKRVESTKMANSREIIASFGLDDSQKAAVSNCVALTECSHRNSVKLIWGPPGTGKTKTISSLVYALMKLKCRTVTCAPTNVAILGVVKRLMSCMSEKLEHEAYGVGDVVLFGNGQRMKIDEHQELHDVFLDHRISELRRLLAPVSGWKGVANEMISILEDPQGAYERYLEQVKRNDDATGLSIEALIKLFNKNRHKHNDSSTNVWTLEEFFENKFVSVKTRLVSCITGLITHLPTSLLRLGMQEKMMRVSNMLQTLETFLHHKQQFMQNEDFSKSKNKCLLLVKSFAYTLSLPELEEYSSIKEFCLKNACLIFCTVSSSAKLYHIKEMTPFELVIIDEAAQVKECETSIPLQLPGLRHAILVGDEKQLPAMVMSKVETCPNLHIIGRCGMSLFSSLT